MHLNTEGKLPLVTNNYIVHLQMILYAQYNLYAKYKLLNTEVPKLV